MSEALNSIPGSRSGSVTSSNRSNMAFASKTWRSASCHAWSTTETRGL